ncbi:tRNA adenosine(34) deaminase TadA [Thalassomonas viridans]|uniref:tRNA-specific adenosine deaminase n=1 Tax=Thalassomonas viridans TaxID=137584 RepID=A0AAE9Z7P4_9GAMM|nr:tRNA adenosine(34) deaminase TadA [Thalassomonas viridans]WDE06617.1 tRNA adenosine(34) deaminase TadA [Thalassomonas viridans]
MNNHKTRGITETTAAQDRIFMQRAYELAQQAETMDEIPVGAVIVSGGKIIAEGFNQSICSHDPSAHAEMVAIRQAGKVINNYRMLDCTLYVTLEPCAMCAGLLVHSRIKRLVYASDDKKTGAAGSVFNLVACEQLNHQLEVTSGVMQAECSELLSAFFKRRRAEKKAEKKKKLK